jgi:DNA-binding transcriptional MerR regulator
VSSSAHYLNPSAAARRLGVSTKALRLYEQRGLVAPVRTAAGWRAYGPDEMARAAEIAALRALGLSLSQVARVLRGDAGGLEAALATHQATLEGQVRQIGGAIDKVRGLRTDLVQGRPPAAGELARLLGSAAELCVSFELPWPWGGELFELRDVRALTYIVGPLGSGKTRLAMRLAEALPGAAFVGLERTAARLDTEPALKAHVERALAWLVEDGAVETPDLIALLAELEAEGPVILVIDMVERGLDEATQEALIAHLRRRGPAGRPLFLMTRSHAILDLDAVGPDEAILLCPANHTPPVRVAPYPGAPGYEAVATCLGSPEARARTEGLIAMRPNAA